MTKSDDSASKIIRRDWENRLAFLNGELPEEDSEEYDDLEEAAQDAVTRLRMGGARILDAGGRPARRQRKKKAKKPKNDLDPSNSFAKRSATARANRYLEKELSAAKRRIAIRLSNDASRVMRRRKSEVAPDDLALVEALLCKSTLLMLEAGFKKDAASQRLLIASWLNDYAEPGQLPRALRLVESAQEILGAQERIKDLKRDIRLRISVEREKSSEKDV